MDKLWAPWRSKFVYDRKRRRCIFCISKKSGKKADREKHIIERSSHCFSMLNKYPYNNGHIMIVPFRHVSSFEYLTDKEIISIMHLLNRTKKILDDILKPHGYNVGMNIGRTAGAGFKGHIHVHIVPRWDGDTNFMPVLNRTKVISESLDMLYERIKLKC